MALGSLAGVNGQYDPKVFFGVLLGVDFVPLFWNLF